MKLIERIFYICAIFIGLACGNTARAVTADAVTAKAVDKFGKSPSITAAFTVTAQGNTVQGSITVAGDRFFLDMNGMQTWYDGRTQWTYMSSTNEVSITEPSTSELAQINPFVIVSSLRKSFTTRLVKSTTSSNTVAYTPKGKSDLSRLTVTYSTATSWPTVVVIANANTTVTIKIKAVSVGKTLHPSTFIYNKKLHPKAEIIDLR
jgi:outer membrane lipoprotein-sorting protein